KRRGGRRAARRDAPARHRAHAARTASRAHRPARARAGRARRGRAAARRADEPARLHTPHSRAEKDKERAVTEDVATNDALREQVAALRSEIARAFVGQREIVDAVAIALLAGGHVLLEGVPGLGKTLLVRALAKAFGGSFARVQFTPDLMPSDVSGHAVYDTKTESFRIRRGPIFANLLLADEINRAPAKTQAALLEAMQEQQVTIEGRSMPLPPPFMAVATQ